MEHTKKKKRNPLILLIVKLAIFVAVVCAVFTFVLGGIRVSDNNMFPMIKSGDFCLFYRLDKAYIDDPVVYEDNYGNFKIGRIAAIAGQEVNFPQEGGYTVDGTTPGEFVPYETYKAEDSSMKYPAVVGQDEYFILNDYRENTDDSRMGGFVPAKNVKGRIIFILRRRSI